MKKTLGLALAAALLWVAPVTPVVADDVTLTLEVTYDSPTPDSPGIWELFGRVDDTGSGADGSLGISAIRALIREIDFGTDGDAVTIVDGIGAITLPGGGFPVLDLGMVIEVLYGQDISDTGEIVTGVGLGGDQLIAFGTFSTGMDPDWGMDGMLSSEALFLTSATPGGGNAISPDTTFTVVVRNNIPEPSSMALLAVVGLTVAGIRKRTVG